MLAIIILTSKDLYTLLPLLQIRAKGVRFISPAKFPKDFLVTDSGGFIYINPKLFRENFAQDVNSC